MSITATPNIEIGGAGEGLDRHLEVVGGNSSQSDQSETYSSNKIKSCAENL